MPPSRVRRDACRATARTRPTTSGCLTAKPGPLCLTCHAKTKNALQTAKVPHAPAAADECTACHDAHGSNVKGILKDRMDRVCFSCHTDAETSFLKTYTHQPVRDGECSSCHQPHGSGQKGLLKADGAKLCESCHADLMKPLEDGAKHGPFVEGMCLNCHNPHGSNVKGMAADKIGALCSACHGEVDEAVGAGKSKHQPAVAGECTACHNPHQTALQGLLLAKGPDLCLACHKDDQVGNGRRTHPLAGRPGLPPLSQAPCVRREPADGQARPDRCARTVTNRARQPSARRTCRSTRRGCAASAATTPMGRRNRTSSRATFIRRLR